MVSVFCNFVVGILRAWCSFNMFYTWLACGPETQLHQLDFSDWTGCWHRRTAQGAEGGCSPPRIFQIAIFGQKKKSGNIRAKPLYFRASNGKNIRARDFSPPERNSSRTLMVVGNAIQCVSKKKVIHIQRPIVLKSIDLKICMWHISEEQLILFPLVPFLHQVCHAWPSTLPMKMTMSWPTLCKFS